MKRNLVLLAALIIVGCSEKPIQPDADKEKLRKVIQLHDREIKECYDKVLKKNPKISGKLVVLWTIDDTGKVSKAEIKSSDLKSPETEDCVLSKSQKWLFPSPPKGETAVISYPYTFVPESNGR